MPKKQETGTGLFLMKQAQVKNIPVCTTRWFLVLGIPASFASSFNWAIWRRKTVYKFNVALSSSGNIGAAYFAVKQTLTSEQPEYLHWNGPPNFWSKEDCNWLRHAFGDSLESSGKVKVRKNFLPFFWRHGPLFPLFHSSRKRGYHPV